MKTFGGQFSSIGGFSNLSYKSRLSINETTIKEYQELLAKRSEGNVGVGRYIVELIKTLRETFPQRENKRKQEEMGNGEKENLLGKGQAGKVNKTSGFEKKLKEVTQQQAKYKQ